MNMTPNMGKNDRAIRAVVGVLLLVFAFFFVGGGFAWLLGLLGVIALATSALKFCPAYTALGMKTTDG